MIGSGEAGALLGPGEEGPGEDGLLGYPTICLRFFILLISSLKLLAICSGVSGDSVNDEGFWSSPSLIFFSGVQCMGTHLRRLFGLFGE